MLMHDAEQQNSLLKADVNYMENYKALEEMKDFESLSMMGGPTMTLVKKATMGSKLPGIGSAMLGNANQM